MKNEEEWDRLLDSVFEDAVRENYRCEVPDPAPSWEKVRERLKAEKRKRVRRSWRIRVSAIAASLIIGAFIFGSPQMTNAFEPIGLMFKQLTGNMLSFFYGESGLEKQTEARTSPPPLDDISPSPHAVGSDNSDADGPRVTNTLKTTLEEARQRSAVPLLEPQYVIAGYKLDSVKLSLDQNGTALDTVMYYMNEEGSFYLVTQSHLELNTSLSTVYDDNDQVKDITINGFKGALIQGSVSHYLLLAGNDTLIKITGSMSVEDMIKIAESLK
ncbi:DUF4367 domain-containing protein [Paenibacillus sp. J2TS4]|uniref:DUF4367 domain-containing protein n=1 Tax=Paenibacillus sp. J2TS4 TaxID=2807194 RepID=UPI001B19BCED|nr:DUF4367 domain-containing protein [Paenibacillus sp. J2TS4]GIP31243.1 hypothetical protein J2TS4_04530 [Paenibacillus sp. J2TS4]